jgi:hypothetical protein
MELAVRTCRNGGMTGQLNKIHSVRTIALVAQELGENEDWLAELAIEMEPEDGLIWVLRLERFSTPKWENAITPSLSSGA